MSNLSPVQFDIQKMIEWKDWRHECVPRLKYAAKLNNVPHLPTLEPHDATFAIVGAGPSAGSFLDAIRYIKGTGRDMVMAVNAMHQWLIERDIIPHIHVLFEPDIEDLEKSLGGPPHKDVTYYLASHCPLEVFRSLKDYRRVLWHVYYPFEEYQHRIHQLFPGEAMVAGGYCTFFRNLTIATILGFRNFELFGLDSSFDEESSHIQDYGGYHDIEEKVDIWGVDPKNKEMKKFTTQGGLAFQAVEFLRFCEINHKGLNIRVHGDGLLRYLHESRYPEQYQT